MDGVYDIIRLAGRIPLDELVLRSSDSPEMVTRSIQQLKDKGLVTITGPFPTTPDQAAKAGDTIIELTSRGFSALAAS